jgi:hypothetical protein
MTNMMSVVNLILNRPKNEHDELFKIEEQLKAALDLPAADRESTIARILARYLNNKELLPDDLRKFLDN